MVTRVGLHCVIVAFPGHTHLFKGTRVYAYIIIPLKSHMCLLTKVDSDEPVQPPF